MANTTLVAVTTLRELTENLLISTGLTALDAEQVADSIIEANLCGIDPHGVAILPTYIKRLKMGGANPKPNIKLEKEGPGFAVFDGDHCLGAVVAAKAMQKAIHEAKQKGVYLAVCKNSNTFGAAFYYSMMAVHRNLIGIALCNAPRSMPPWGGKTPLLGTNPISVAIPVEGKPPIVLDMATSAAAKSKIYLARDKEEKIPLGWALDENGNPTTDPEEALKGILLPLGGHKGYGLSLLVDILAGVLSGSGSLELIGSLHNQTESCQNVGFFFIAINPSLITEASAFALSMLRFTETIKACPALDKQKPVLLPGELEASTRLVRLRDGIPVPDSIMGELNDLSKAIA